MEFGILGSDDGLPEFSDWKRKRGDGQRQGIRLLTVGFEHHKCEDKDSQKVYTNSVS
jgi:hypothetical protein